MWIICEDMDYYGNWIIVKIELANKLCLWPGPTGMDVYPGLIPK